MDIVYRTKAIQRICEDASEATKQHGRIMADLVHRRIDQIRAAESVEMLVEWRIGECHPLKGNRIGQYAMDLKQPYRLVFEKVDEDRVVVKVLEIVDYH